MAQLVQNSHASGIIILSFCSRLIFLMYPTIDINNSPVAYDAHAQKFLCQSLKEFEIWIEKKKGNVEKY